MSTKFLNLYNYFKFRILEIFNSSYNEFNEIISNIEKSTKSDVVISYGNNNYVTKILINDILKTKSENDSKFEVKVINFNSHIHTTEDLILKKLCREIGIEVDKTGFDGSRSSIEEYYKRLQKEKKNSCINKKNSLIQENQPLIVIYFENIEYLFVKKKQVLFYTMLEIVNMSCNMLLCGMTSNFNLMDLMEKRIRSRFSQKTIFIRIQDESIIVKVLQEFFNNYNNSIHLESKTSLQNFFITFLSTNKINESINNIGVKSDKLNFNIIVLIQKYIFLGSSIKEIITKLKYILTMIMMNINKIQEKEKDIFNNTTDFAEIIDSVITEYVTDEMNGSYFNLLKSKIKIFYLLIFMIPLYFKITNRFS